MRSPAEVRAAIDAVSDGPSGALAALRDELAAAIDARGAPALDAGHPIAWLPVRVETRFLAGALVVRIYPDDLHADAHDPVLSPAEWAAAVAYQAGPRDDAAWAALITGFGPTRAAWLAHVEPGPAPPDPGAHHAVRGAARARLLPDRFEIVGYRAGAEVVRAHTRPVRYPLALSIDPARAADAAGPGWIDPEARWLIDLDEAIAAGMAIRIPLDGATARDGVDTLVVYGLRSGDPGEAAAALDALLAAQRYTRGLALVAPGTPTNNTARADSPFGALHDPVRTRPTDRDRALSTALWRALGVAPPDERAALPGLNGTDAGGAWVSVDEAAARGFLTALWPATLGYFGRHLADQLDSGDAVRADVLRYLRGGGPLPAFRIGNTPYGVLPIATRHDDPPGPVVVGPAAPAAPTPVPFGGTRWAPLIRDALAVAGEHLAPTTRFVGATGDAVDDVLRVLSQDASARGVRFRLVFGPEAQQLFAWDGGGAAPRPAALTAIAHRIWECRALNLALHASSHSLSGNFSTIDGRAAPYQVVAPAATLATLAATPLPALLGGGDPATPFAHDTAGELYDLVVAIFTRDSERTPAPGALPSPQVTDLITPLIKAALLEAWLDGCLAKLRALGRSVHDLHYELELDGLGGQPDRLNAILSATTVSDRDGTAITLGTWIEREARRADPAPEAAGLAEVLRALATLAALPDDVLSRGLGETLDVVSHRLDAWWTAIATQQLDALRARAPAGIHLGCFAWVDGLRPASRRPDTTGGFIQAPSMNQAAAAAVLRNGVLSRRSDHDEVEIDLSSGPARVGLGLIDAVRKGQPLGAILGYRFERALQDRRCHNFIEAFRALYPLTAAGLGDDVATTLAGRTVDGLALARKARAALPGRLSLPLTTADPAQLDRVYDAIAAIERDLDAVHDLLFAESVFQLVQGRPSTAYAAFEALADGKALPSIDFVRTPRAAASIEYRIAIACDPGAPAAPGWDAIPASPRARLEPGLDAWLGAQLGDPAQLALPGGLTAIDLGLRPVDYLAVIEGFPLDLPDAGPAGPLVAQIHPIWRLVRAAMIAHGGDPAIDLTELPAIHELAARMMAARDLLDHARPLRPGDLDLSAPAPAIEDGRAALIELLAAAPLPTDPVGLHRCALQWDARLEGDDDEAIAAGLAAQLASRRARATGTAEARVRALLGPRTHVLPRFAAGDRWTADEPAGLFPDAAYPRGRELRRWFDQVARVRAGVGRLRAFELAIVAGGGARMPWRLTQTPAGRWIGSPGGPPPDGALCTLVTGAPGAIAAGFLVDRWREAVPSRRVTTATAFHYDDPGAEAAQAVLLAVPPPRGWQPAVIEAQLIDALALVRMRVASWRDLGPLANVLPAIYLRNQVTKVDP